MTSDVKRLYLHIPFCHRVCHYCDFAKTANYSKDHLRAYLEFLVDELRFWLKDLTGVKFDSVFFGGGTPSLFQEEYASIFAELPLPTECEITLEANPEHCQIDNLKKWRELGFNRISLGIQSFQEDHLRFLTREHSKETALRAVHDARSEFANVSVDLIYGLPNQTVRDLLDDLELVRDLPHVSLYHLTYEPRTVLGRRKQRQLLQELEDEMSFELYRNAAKQLAELGFVHDEVSNWHKPGFYCRHNRGYWYGDYYLGIGSGAHGFLPSGEIGTRYSYAGSDRSVLKRSREVTLSFEENRTKADWLLERIGSGLRTERGLEIAELESVSQCSFRLNPRLEWGANNGLLKFEKGFLKFQPLEWFRDNQWALAVFDSFLAEEK